MNRVGARAPGRSLAASLLIVLAGAALARVARADTVVIYSAGSLRNVVAELARQAGSAFGVEVQPTFGGSGTLRERIEEGEHADLLMSADLGSPRKLESEGRTVVPVIAFARNRMCIVSRRSQGVTPANLIDRLLTKSVRLKTSTPIVDPSGDYAWAIFERIEALRPGAGAILKEKARASMNLHATPARPTESATAALFETRQIDMTITYCSGVPSLLVEAPALTSLEVPAELDPHPIDGIAVLSTKPQVLRLVLFLLSERGQAIVSKAGLVPIANAEASRSARP